ncbi:MAG: alpha/beta hydrolase [Acidobacteria bacterium]|nr:alpha/beta hydrolase [Acidobacteriota bacterium]
MKLSRKGFLKRSASGIGAFLLLLSAASCSQTETVDTTQSMGGSMGEAKFVDVDGIRTRYFEGGSGEAMLLVHGGHYGASGGATGWMSIFPNLAAHFNVYAIDKLGMGFTDPPGSDEEYTMQATVQHLYRFLETLGIEEVHLVGHSRGGLPVTRIAIDHPEMVKTLTIFDSNTLAPGDPPVSIRPLGPPGPPPTKESIREGLLNNSTTFHKDFITDEYVEAQLEVRLLPKIRETAEKMEQLRLRFAELNPEKVEARPALAGNRGTGWWMYEVKDATLEAITDGRLSTPTLIIWGFNDPSATYAMGVDLFQTISTSVDRAQLHFFNRSGHSPYHEYPQEVTNVLVSFIGSEED